MNNAGVQNPAAPIEHTELRTWEHTFGVNVTGQFLGIRAVTPSMRRGGGGTIVNIASTMAHVGTAFYAPYTASKWAVRGLTRTAALELGRDNIRVNSIHPGVVSTPLVNEPTVAGQPAIADFYSPDPFAIPGSPNPPRSPVCCSSSPPRTPLSPRARNSSLTGACCSAPHSNPKPTSRLEPASQYGACSRGRPSCPHSRSGAPGRAVAGGGTGPQPTGTPGRRLPGPADGRDVRRAGRPPARCPGSGRGHGGSSWSPGSGGGRDAAPGSQGCASCALLARVWHASRRLRAGLR